jgi:hypothetical protein
MDPLIASSLISTGGSLVSGLLGGDDGPSAMEQINHNAYAQRLALRKVTHEKMRLAKQYNIHPLTMLGTQAPQASSPVYHQKENMGQNVATALAKGASDYFTGKANQKMNDLAIERAQLENQLLKTQISSINNPAATAGTAYSNDQRVLNVADENIHRKKDETGLTAGSENPPPAGKRFTVGNTPYGEVYITLPASGQADEYGEVYGAIKGLEYLAKRGYVHYARGTYKAGKKLGALLRGNKKKRPYSTSTKKGYSKITW